MMNVIRNKEVSKWGGLLLYAAVSIAWFFFSLVIQAINGKFNVEEIKDAIEAISCQLCSGVHRDGDINLPGSFSNGWTGVQASPRQVREATCPLQVSTQVNMLVPGVPKEGSSAFPFASEWKDTSESHLMVLALGDRSVSKRGGWNQCKGCEIRNARLRHQELWPQGGTEELSGWFFLSREILGCVGR